MKELLYQKYYWVKQLIFFLFNIVRCAVNSIFYLLVDDKELSLWWFNEIKETWCWIKIHSTYKSKRIK